MDVCEEVMLVVRVEVRDCVAVDVGVVVGVLVTVELGEVVMVVVGVVTWHFTKVPFTRASIISFSDAAVRLHSVVSVNKNPNAHSMSSKSA